MKRLVFFIFMLSGDAFSSAGARIVTEVELADLAEFMFVGRVIRIEDVFEDVEKKASNYLEILSMDSHDVRYLKATRKVTLDVVQLLKGDPGSLLTVEVSVEKDVEDGQEYLVSHVEDQFTSFIPFGAEYLSTVMHFIPSQASQRIDSKTQRNDALIELGLEMMENDYFWEAGKYLIQKLVMNESFETWMSQAVSLRTSPGPNPMSMSQRASLQRILLEDEDDYFASTYLLPMTWPIIKSEVRNIYRDHLDRVYVYSEFISYQQMFGEPQTTVLMARYKQLVELDEALFFSKKTGEMPDAYKGWDIDEARSDLSKKEEKIGMDLIEEFRLILDKDGESGSHP